MCSIVLLDFVGKRKFGKGINQIRITFACSTVIKMGSGTFRAGKGADESGKSDKPKFRNAKPTGGNNYEGAARPKKDWDGARKEGGFSGGRNEGRNDKPNETGTGGSGFRKRGYDAGEGQSEGNSGGGKSYGKGKPGGFGNRSEGGKPPFKKWEDRGGSRPDGDKPPFKKWEDRGGSRPDGDKPPFKKWEDRGGSSPEGGKPPFKKWEDRGGSRPDGDKPPFKKWEDRGGSRPEGDKPPFKKWEDRGGSRPEGDKPPFKKWEDRGGSRPGGDKPPFKKWEDRGDKPGRSAPRKWEDRNPDAGADEEILKIFDKKKNKDGEADKSKGDRPKGKLGSKKPTTFSDRLNADLRKESRNITKRSYQEPQQDPARRLESKPDAAPVEDVTFGELENKYASEEQPPVLKSFKVKKSSATADGEPDNAVPRLEDPSADKFAAEKDGKSTKKRIVRAAGSKQAPRRDEDDDEDDEVVDKPIGNGLMPLNKFIAHCGECSRRDAGEIVKQGKVKVDGELVTDPGFKVGIGAQVILAGKKLVYKKGLVYILLNKPKGYITTNDDPQGRRTVMDLISDAGTDRLYPVGRLDRDTSGLLLITNDGDLTQKLSHPSFEIKKVYHVTLDKALTKNDFEKIMGGLELEDGKAIVDEMAYLEDKKELGLEIHSGKNRIVRRIFESLGYTVEKLDRVMYSGLTKKNLPRGKWRNLTDRELVLLKHFKS